MGDGINSKKRSPRKKYSTLGDIILPNADIRRRNPSLYFGSHTHTSSIFMAKHRIKNNHSIDLNNQSEAMPNEKCLTVFLDQPPNKEIAKTAKLKVTKIRSRPVYQLAPFFLENMDTGHVDLMSSIDSKIQTKTPVNPEV
jgi:hypothetical protein